MAEYVDLVEVSKIPLDRGLTVLAGTREIAIFRVRGEIKAIDGRCPHRGGPLGEGLQDGECVYCPLHGWKFNISTGACFDRPEKPVASFPVRIVDGRVQALLDP